MRREDSITVATGGANIATSGTSAGVVVPVTSAGTKPNYIRVTATAPAYVRMGIGVPTAVAGDMLVQPADAVLLSVGGFTHIAAVQVSSAGIVNITPLDDIQ